MAPHNTNNCSGGVALQHVYNAFNNPKETRVKLAQKPYKIKCYSDILTRKSKVQKHQDVLDQQTRKTLLKVAEYMQATHYRPSIGNAEEEFSADTFADYVTSSILIANTCLDQVFKTLRIPKQDIKILQQEYGINGCEDLVTKQGQLLEKAESIGPQFLDKRKRTLFVKLAGYLELEARHLSNASLATKRKMLVDPVPHFTLDAFETYLVEETVTYVVNKAPKPEAFNLEWCRDLLTRWVQHLSQLFSKSQKEFIVYGPTQVGKSRSKDLIAAFCNLFAFLVC